VKIATFNINNVNKRLENLLVWLADGQPDIVCLQELKAEARVRREPQYNFKKLQYRLRPELHTL